MVHFVYIAEYAHIYIIIVSGSYNYYSPRILYLYIANVYGYEIITVTRNSGKPILTTRMFKFPDNILNVASSKMHIF